MAAFFKMVTERCITFAPVYSLSASGLMSFCLFVCLSFLPFSPFLPFLSFSYFLSFASFLSFVLWALRGYEGLEYNYDYLNY
jgi:hypothetical protein